MFFIKEENVRPGNRGGKDLFKWDIVRAMNNKDRESYLGATQSIGFLDKGGKWRKRDWWQSNKSTELIVNSSKKMKTLQDEKEAIKMEEDRLIRESLGLGNVDKVSQSQIKKEKLSDYEMKELMKKEGKFNREEEEKLFEFYKNDEHKAGLGMNKKVTFRTNAYEKNVLKNLSRLDGENIEEKDENETNPYLEAVSNKKDENAKNPLISKYISEYVSSKNEIKEKVKKEDDISRKEKQKSNHRSRSREHKKKKSKKSRSRSRDRSRSHDNNNYYSKSKKDKKKSRK